MAENNIVTVFRLPIAFHLISGSFERWALVAALDFMKCEIVNLILKSRIATEYCMNRKWIEDNFYPFLLSDGKTL